MPDLDHLGDSLAFLDRFPSIWRAIAEVIPAWFSYLYVFALERFVAILVSRLPINSGDYKLIHWRGLLVLLVIHTCLSSLPSPLLNGNGFTHLYTYVPDYMGGVSGGSGVSYAHIKPRPR
jgi:hypothetical protein